MEKLPNESNQEHYARLLKMKQDLEPVLRDAKRKASFDANQAELDRRYKRDKAKIHGQEA